MKFWNVSGFAVLDSECEIVWLAVFFLVLYYTDRVQSIHYFKTLFAPCWALLKVTSCNIALCPDRNLNRRPLRWQSATLTTTRLLHKSSQKGQQGQTWEEGHEKGEEKVYRRSRAEHKSPNETLSGLVRPAVFRGTCACIRKQRRPLPAAGRDCDLQRAWAPVFNIPTTFVGPLISSVNAMHRFDRQCDESRLFTAAFCPFSLTPGELSIRLLYA